MDIKYIPKTFNKSTACAGDLPSIDSVPSLCFQCSPFPGGYKEMSSILADQLRLLIRVPMGGGGGVAGPHPMSTAVHNT